MARVTDFSRFRPSDTNIDFAYDVTDKKHPYIDSRSPSGKDRSKKRIITNIFHGCIAQAAVVEVLNLHGAKRVEMYDEVRTDSFKDPDPWDIRACTSTPTPFKKESANPERDGSDWTVHIEVRSSYTQKKCLSKKEKRKRLACIQNKYRLISGYSTAAKPGEKPKDLFFQVYWLYSQKKAEQLLANYHDNKRDFAQQCPEKVRKCFVVGFSTPRQLGVDGHDTSLGQQGASYRCVGIDQAKPVSNLSRFF